MKDAAAQTVFLKDYRAPIFTITETALHFDLFEEETLVTANLRLERRHASDEPLVLDGQELELLGLDINGEAVPSSQYSVDDNSLRISDVPDRFLLTCRTRIRPHLNTSLEGLYRSRSMYCTQCEAEGFRKITYYLDRPDVLSVFTTSIKADATKYPVLLSNGNLVEEGSDVDGNHWVKWHDPFPKPSYLFALVAGKLAFTEDTFTTASGKTVTLRIYVESKDLDKCEHAMLSLKRSMRWDEEVYGREYDLDIFMIVAVDDFNMGAMENKGLNIFNTSCVLANPQTTTDAGFQRVEGVVAHEYFHNWSGNRVTCRDWFQLSLKEGFTVFRDAEFSADMGSRTVKRVEDVQLLQTLQFAEDAGPTAHPVQPQSFMEISNFYTLTIYEKGAEIVRMIHTLLGPELFRKGTDLYFQNNDGKAVTIEDFVNAMAEVSGRDFSQFMLWYRQAGTPELDVEGHYDAEKQQYLLKVRQYCRGTPEATAEQKKPFVIPLAMGLLGPSGPIPLVMNPDPGTSRAGTDHAVLELTQTEECFVFENVAEQPVPALLRNFSAPVKLRFPYRPEELKRLLADETDGYCRWDAAQKLALIVIKEMIAEGQSKAFVHLREGFAGVLDNEHIDQAMVALMLELPAESYIGDQFEVIDVTAIHNARQAVRLRLVEAFPREFRRVYERCNTRLEGTQAVDAQSMALRALMNKTLGYLVQLDDASNRDLCVHQFYHGRNMTESFGALACLTHCELPSIEAERDKALAFFYEKWHHESLVVNQWLSVQASSTKAGTLSKVRSLLQSPAFDQKNPNKIRSLIGAFSNSNLVNFHQQSGDGYRFLADQVIQLNSQNPQIAARLITPLSKWRRYDLVRQQLMKAELNRILNAEKLSTDVFEIASKSVKD